MTRKNQCPRCGCAGIVRSHRKPFERVLMILKPRRCLQCQHRFLVLEKLGAGRRGI